MNYNSNIGPRNPEEMSHMMSEFHRQSLIQQPAIDQNSQPSAGYGLFLNQASAQPPSELRPSQRSWPQSEFVSSVIEDPIERANPGWRDQDPVSASSLRQRAEAGMQNAPESTTSQAIFQRSRGTQSSYLASGTPFSINGSSRDNKKIIPSHLTHMKYKGYDPSEIENAGIDPSLRRDDAPSLTGTASFGSKARRRTDTVSLVEDEQKRKDLEQQLANFPPLLPSAIYNSLSEEDAEIKRGIIEDDMRTKWNISNRSTSPNLTRRSTYNKHGGSHRRTSVSIPQDERASSSALSSSVTNFGPQASKSDVDKHFSETPVYASVKASHPLLIANNNTWDRILEHMLNHGTIVNPFNHKTKFRLKACFPPSTPIDILASGDTRQSEYPVNIDLLKQANEVVMGPDWIKMTYESKSQATNALSSNGVYFDGFPLQVSAWGEADEFALKAGTMTELPQWMLLSPDVAQSLPLRTPSHLQGESVKVASHTKDRQLVVLHDEAIFLKHPGLIDRLKQFVYGYFFQSTAKYDEDGNYIKGSGGIFLDLWHVLTS